MCSSCLGAVLKHLRQQRARRCPLPPARGTGHTERPDDGATCSSAGSGFDALFDALFDDGYP